MNIRLAEIGDAPTIAEFNRAMALETEDKTLDPDVVLNGVRAVFANANKGFYAIAEDNGVPTGVLMVTFEWSDWRNGMFWWIQSVYVLPEYRGRGIYSRLYEFLKSKAANSDVCGFRLYAETHNTHAQDVYVRLGMQRCEYVMYEELL